ncbi:MAG: peptidase M14 [Saprospiraceae bacterium]|nr:peptidase M14 [Saprospiraceae bacterium]
MRLKKYFIYTGLLVLLNASAGFAQNNYANHAQLSARLKALASKYSGQASVQSIGKSQGGRDIWALTLGGSTADAKPAILVVAGVDGAHLAGTEIAIEMAEKMLAAANTDSISQLLRSKTLYFVPSVNPDAQEQASARLKFERSGNDSNTDDDRDGRLNEDPFEDLNNDGIITILRVEDATGTYVVSKDDPRVMVKAEGEVGKYLLLSEGIDNDKDGEFNEDGIGGVNIDKNFTFDYPVFIPGSGEYAASESEVRALMTFLYEHQNIFAVLTFGPANNLSAAPTFDAARANRRIPTAPTQKDVTVMTQVSKIYNQTGLKDGPTMPHTKGNFSQTAYFHGGRFSFSTPGWWVPKVEIDSTKRAPAATGGPRAGGGGAPKAGEEDIQFLKWADKEKLTNTFVDWTTIQHPDFPGQKAEVGGIAPYAKWNPPVSYLADVSDKHVQFLIELSEQMPEIQVVNVKNESLGNGISRITATVVNKGLMPTYADIGDRVRFIQKMKTELKLGNGQAIVSGRRLYLRNTLGAGESEEYSWLVSGTGKATIEAGCPTTGVKSVEVTLK